ncbi:MAG: DinB family protein [Ignavibacteriales bacterium]|nr:DinB family protein [Ignavibacteriales bacterium]
MLLKEMRELYAYDRWADMRMLQALEHATEAHWNQDLKSSHGGLHGTLHHLIGANVIWLQRWQGKPPQALKIDEVPTVASIKSVLESYHADVQRFLDSLTQERLEGQIHYKDLKGNAYAQPLYQLMQHKVNHSTYHRGQVTAMLRMLGLQPIGTDLVTYYREQLHG